MKRVAVLGGGAVVAALVGGVSAPDVASAQEPPEWVLENCADARGGAVTKIFSGVVCDLRNTKTNKCLVQASQSDQTDWSFAECRSRPRNLRLFTRTAQPIACGETFAMKLGSEFFRKCERPQRKGINVCSEKASPPQARHFDWQLVGCTGQLEAGKPVALFNVSRKDSVVYAPRPGDAVDTCWADKRRYGRCATVRDD